MVLVFAEVAFSEPPESKRGWCLGDSDRHRAVRPGQASPLHALRGTGRCGSAHISGRSGASSCPGSSPSPLWGTRWNQAVGSQATQLGAPFPLFSPARLLPRDGGECPGKFSSNPPECPAPQRWREGLRPHCRQLLQRPGSHSPHLPLLSPGLTEENGLLATRAGPAHGSAQRSRRLT